VLRQGIDANLAAPSPRALVASQPEDPGFFIEDFCNWQHNGAYRQFIFGSPLAAVASRLMQSRTARLYHDHMLTKEPGTRQPTPWHQDQPYYNVDGTQNVSFWIPVDPVSRAATLEFAAGTHRGPWLMPRTFMTNEARWFPAGTLAELPDIEAGRHAQPPTHRILGWALEPGDAVAFHMLTLHATGGVEPGRRRRIESARLLLPAWRRERASQPRRFLPGAQSVHRIDVVPMVANRSFEITVDFEQRSGDQGVLWALGDVIGGIVAYVEADRLNIHYNGFGEPSNLPGVTLEPGERVAKLEYRALGTRRGEGRLLIDGTERVGWTELSPTLMVGLFEGLDVGIDRRAPVYWDLYERHGTFRYTGRIVEVRIVPGDLMCMNVLRIYYVNRI
jgi:hypothetical protein